MKRDLNIHITFNNKVLYTFISFIAILIIGVGVFALTPGVAPNPGHLISEVAPPAGCGTNQVLQWSGSAWTCANPVAQSGEVIAFNLSTCPTGWSEFTGARGRTIIGTGQGAGLTNRILGDIGGEEMHNLTIAEMPSHTHSFPTSPIYGVISNTASGNGGDSGYWADFRSLPNTNPTGGSQPHNIMQPYISLLYCVKK